MAVVDADYNFSYANVGCQGRISDRGVFRNCDFYQKLEINELHLLQSSCLPGTNKELPYVFVADEAFGSSEHLMKPYSGLQSRNQGTNIQL